MGIKIVLTEAQIERLESKVGKVEISEARLSCTDLYYGSLSNFLNGKDERKLGNNTIVHRLDDETVAIMYHRTNILKINSESVVTINTGGWETTTTKDRLNQFLSCRGFGIFQKKGTWYIRGNDETVPYEDGMSITADGTLIRAAANKIKANVLNLIKNKEIDPKYGELYGLSGYES
jgi:hypothetical protein